jgi:hypothetical protein
MALELATVAAAAAAAAAVARTTIGANRHVVMTPLHPGWLKLESGERRKYHDKYHKQHPSTGPVTAIWQEAQQATDTQGSTVSVCGLASSYVTITTQPDLCNQHAGTSAACTCLTQITCNQPPVTIVRGYAHCSSKFQQAHCSSAELELQPYGHKAYLDAFCAPCNF